MMYSISDGMKPLFPMEGLVRGQFLKLNGYDNPRYVIIGVIPDTGYGMFYETLNLTDLTFGRKDARMLKHIDEKKDNRIQMYVLDEFMDDDLLNETIQLAKNKKEMEDKKAEQDKIERDRLIQKGKEIMDRVCPDGTKSVIVASMDINDCDLMTDYFNARSGDLIVIGFSKSTRDNFKELRRCASLIPETKHLSTVPTVDENGHERTENNKGWWHPKDEHREKYSMGAGYYLKDGNRYDTGWKVEKRRMWNTIWDDCIYISLAKRNIFE